MYVFSTSYRGSGRRQTCNKQHPICSEQDQRLCFDTDDTNFVVGQTRCSSCTAVRSTGNAFAHVTVEKSVCEYLIVLNASSIIDGAKSPSLCLSLSVLACLQRCVPWRNRFLYLLIDRSMYLSIDRSLYVYVSVETLIDLKQVSILF